MRASTGVVGRVIVAWQPSRKSVTFLAHPVKYGKVLVGIVVVSPENGFFFRRRRFLQPLLRYWPEGRLWPTRPWPPGQRPSRQRRQTPRRHSRHGGSPGMTSPCPSPCAGRSASMSYWRHLQQPTSCWHQERQWRGLFLEMAFQAVMMPWWSSFSTPVGLAGTKRNSMWDKCSLRWRDSCRGGWWCGNWGCPASRSTSASLSISCSEQWGDVCSWGRQWAD